MKQKLIAAWAWLRKHIFNKECIIGALIAEAIFWSPVWIPAILAFTISPWWWTVVTTVIVFWAGPFTPAIALQLGLIVAINKIINKIKEKKKK